MVGVFRGSMCRVRFFGGLMLELVVRVQRHVESVMGLQLACEVMFSLISVKLMEKYLFVLKRIGQILWRILKLVRHNASFFEVGPWLRYAERHLEACNRGG